MKTVSKAMRWLPALAMPWMAISSAAVFAAASGPIATPTVNETPARQKLIERGKYVMSVTGCVDCHAPLRDTPQGPRPDLSRGLSGHPQNEALSPLPKLGGKSWMYAGANTNTAFAGPWGVSFAANLTPDKDTGIGNWSEKVFADTLRTGKHLGTGRPVMPPMPWPVYRNLNEEDMKALYAYLQAQPAVKNRVPAYRPPAQ